MSINLRYIFISVIAKLFLLQVLCLYCRAPIYYYLDIDDRI